MRAFLLGIDWVQEGEMDSREELATWDSVDHIDIAESDVCPTNFDLNVTYAGIKDGELASLDTVIPVECDCAWVDVGIGAYEHWGFVGSDSRMGWEIATLDIEEGWPLKETIIQKIEDAIDGLDGPKRDVDYFF